jgi:hypothetical protein
LGKRQPWHILGIDEWTVLRQYQASGRNMARATLGQSLAVSAFPRYVPV